MDEFNQFFELLERSSFNCLDGDTVFFSLAGELGKETVGRFVAKEDYAALTQALDRSVQAAWGRTKVDHYVNLALASVFRAVDQNSFIQLFVPLNHVHPTPINSRLFSGATFWRKILIRTQLASNFFCYHHSSSSRFFQQPQEILMGSSYYNRFLNKAF